MNTIIRSLILCVVVAITVFCCLRSPKIQVGNAAGVVMNFPATLAGFISKEGKPDPVELKILPEDTQFAKAIFYSDPPTDGYRDRIFGSIVLSGEERKSIHRPEVCLQGQGWTIIQSRTIPINIEGLDGFEIKDLTIEKMVALENGAQAKFRAHYMYWFVGQDITTPDHMSRILLTIKDNIFRRVNHRWAYASMMGVVNDVHPVDQIKMPRRSDTEMVEIMVDLIRKVVPIIQPNFINKES